MAPGEYASASSRHDTGRAPLAKERAELVESPDQGLDELTALYEAKGRPRRSGVPGDGSRSSRTGLTSRIRRWTTAAPARPPRPRRAPTGLT
ncbi:VIT1/CCC1 transporter family protein [Paractinoplanes brasiliensis]|uniref:VIT1/CCC1 transporter family protein n=1 Tax=Paractinoplanes brasiliensis TaxID=52695 RepID=UPI001EF1B5AE|nr:VIT1/CCC1 transporter family protein [Actinoplanes brasiliensis]